MGTPECARPRLDQLGGVSAEVDVARSDLRANVQGSVSTSEIVRDCAWIQETISRNPVLANMQHKIVKDAGHLSVEVLGAHFEARAWRAAINGIIRPSWIDVRGVRHQLVIGKGVTVDVVDRPFNDSVE
jgi:hypothetical protein